jgi:ketosteroid isomerase-like protein
VEIAERFVDAYNRRDVDALAELVTEDFEWITTNAGLVEGGSFRGRTGIEAYFADVVNTWDENRISASELRDLGESVFGDLRIDARGRGSGIPVTTRMWSVSDFRAVIYRKLSLGSQSEGGEQRIERLLSASVTCRLQRRSLFEYLSELIAAHARGDPVSSLA